MTNEQLKKYLSGVIDDIRTLYVRTQEAVQEIQKQSQSEYTKIYGVPIRMTEEQRAQMSAVGQDSVNKLIFEYRETVDKAVQEALDFVATVKKTAVQDLAAAEPVPTDVQLRMAEQIKKKYNSGGNVLSIDRVKQFETDMNYHVDNETVKAYPYYLAAKDLFPDNGNNADILNTVYNKLFPAIAEKQAALDGINELETYFKTAVICHKFDTISNPTEADQLEMIRMKEELQQLGTIGKLNQRVIRYA